MCTSLKTHPIRMKALVLCKVVDESPWVGVRLWMKAQNTSPWVLQHYTLCPVSIIRIVCACVFSLSHHWAQLTQRLILDQRRGVVTENRPFGLSISQPCSPSLQTTPEHNTHQPTQIPLPVPFSTYTTEKKTALNLVCKGIKVLISKATVPISLFRHDPNRPVSAWFMKAKIF